MLATLARTPMLCRPGSAAAVSNAARTAIRHASGYDLDVKDPSHFTLTRQEPKYALGKHRSNALELVSQYPIVEVDGEMAVCDGGGGALGHPVEYISLERPGEIKACIYCGTRFKKKE